MPNPVEISTAGIPRRDAYDFWRSIAFTDFAADRVAREDELAFKASASGLTYEDADFFVTESDAVSGTRTTNHIGSDGLDSLSLGLVVDGLRQARQADDDSVVTGSGGLFVYDAARPSVVAWSRHKAIYLVIRRSHVREILGQDVQTPAALMRILDRSPLKHVLREQLSTVGRYKNLLSPVEQSFLLNQTKQLALFALARPDDADQTDLPSSLLVATAMSYIERHCSELSLGVDRIARDLACSRSTLYRAFGSSGLKVAECIRDARLEKAKQLLEQAPPSVAVSEIAEKCGIYDSANFSRQFRRRFGCTPSDLRRNVR